MADISIINKDNTDYNVKDAAGREALAVVANAGAKNQFNIDASAVVYSCTYTHANNVLAISGTGAYARVAYQLTLSAGKYVFSANVDSLSASGRVRFNTASAGSGTTIAPDIETSTTGGVSQQINLAVATTFYIMFYSKTTSGGGDSAAVYSKIMIRRAEIMDDTYAPYAPTNRELYEEKIGIEDAFGSGTKILTNGTADITEIGNFYCQDAATSATVTNAPWTDSGFFGFVRRSVLPSERFIQIAFKNNDVMAIAKRRYTGTWQPWSYSSSEPRSVGNYIMSYADSLPTPGVYFAYHLAGSGIDKPVSGHRYMYQIMMMSSASGCIHAYELDPSSGAVMYIANKINGTWSSWYKFEGTEVT